MRSLRELHRLSGPYCQPLGRTSKPSFILVRSSMRSLTADDDAELILASLDTAWPGN
jgi:hypothetical protein